MDCKAWNSFFISLYSYTLVHCNVIMITVGGGENIILILYVCIICICMLLYIIESDFVSTASVVEANQDVFNNKCWLYNSGLALCLVCCAQQGQIRNYFTVQLK